MGGRRHRQGKIRLWARRRWHTLHPIWRSDGNVSCRHASLRHHATRSMVVRRFSEIHQEASEAILGRPQHKNGSARTFLYHPFGRPLRPENTRAPAQLRCPQQYWPRHTRPDPSGELSPQLVVELASSRRSGTYNRDVRFKIRTSGASEESSRGESSRVTFHRDFSLNFVRHAPRHTSSV